MPPPQPESARSYVLVVSAPARRAITDGLPENVAAAVVEFLTTSLVENPERVGRALRGDFQGIWSARRGTYRVLYRIRRDIDEVVVLRIDHRRDVYRQAP